jgi:preprotein translocase subunit SecY
MFSAFINSFKVKELRNRILFAAVIVVLCRVAAAIPCPGIDPQALSAYFKELTSTSGGGVLGIYNLFSGGALQKFAIATLGIMPYISASIIITLLTPVVPTLEKLQRQGDVGRQKITQYTRYLTVLICIVQGTVAAMAMINPARIGLPSPSMPLVVQSGPAFMFVIVTVIVLTCGTMVLVWLGEQITKHGIGNGISVIITINIIARMPRAFSTLVEMAKSGSGITDTRFRAVHILILFIIFVGVTALTVMLTQGHRRIPMQMAKRAVGGGVGTGTTTYMPLKVLYAGVMPIIFAGAIMMVPNLLFRLIPFMQSYAVYFAYGSPLYMTAYALMIFVFTFFWVQNQFNPIKIAENLKRDGVYIPGIRPGQPTSEFLDSTMTKITFAGAVFLLALAIFPMTLYNFLGIPMLVASFFGGTSLLIIVGVMLDTLNQLESHLIMHNYDGFLKDGRVRGRKSL